MSTGSFYENASLIAFGEAFECRKPIDILKHFRNRSPFLRDKTMAEYLDHLNIFVDIPARLKDESEDQYYDRVFDVLVKENMVLVDIQIN